jgi:hypothetical protein
VEVRSRTEHKKWNISVIGNTSGSRKWKRKWDLEVGRDL